MATVQQAFGEAVRAIRLQRGLSQEKLAELAEIDRTYISGLERGRRNPALSTIDRIAYALGVEINRLMSMAEKRL